MEKFRARVLSVEKLSPEVCLIKFSLNKKINFRPGQYVFVSLKKEGRQLLRPYSIASNPKNKTRIELIVKRVEGGYASNFLCSLKKEKKIELIGPCGVFRLRENSRRERVFVATGIGIAAIKPMIEVALEKKLPEKNILIFGIRRVEEILLKKHFESLAKKHPRKLEFIAVLSRPDKSWNGEKGHVQDILKKRLGRNLEKKEFYICGVPKMVEDVERFLRNRNVKRENIFREKY